MYTSIELARATFTFIFIFYLFVENTDAKRPSDYCNNIESLSAPLPYFDQNVMEPCDMNQECNITLDQLPSVNQDEIFDIVDQVASLSDFDKGKGPYID